MRRIFNHSSLREKRKELRKNSSPEEIILWNWLRGKKLGVKFRRQTSIGNFIVDFYCPLIRLVIELDGGDHKLKKEYDHEREAFLVSQDCFVLRFPNQDVRERLNHVLITIEEHVALLMEELGRNLA